MCFSAVASFIGGSTITGIGAITLPKIKSKNELPLALVPIFFGIQQFFEGLVWLYPTEHIFAYGFLFFAFLWWPFYFPFVVLRLENSLRKRKVLHFIWGIGAMLALYLAFILFTQPLGVYMVNHSIDYRISIPFHEFALFIYLLATSGVCFFSSKSIVKIFGGFLLVFFLVSYWIYYHAFTSVWCFFAAILSTILLLYFYKRK